MSILRSIFGCTGDAVNTNVQKLLNEVKAMSKQLDDLKAQMAKLVAEVAENTSIQASAVQAIQGLVAQQQVLSEQLAEAIAQNNPVAIQEAANSIAEQIKIMSDSADALAAAIPVSNPEE